MLPFPNPTHLRASRPTNVDLKRSTHLPPSEVRRHGALRGPETIQQSACPFDVTPFIVVSAHGRGMSRVSGMREDG